VTAVLNGTEWCPTRRARTGAVAPGNTVGSAIGLSGAAPRGHADGAANLNSWWHGRLALTPVTQLLAELAPRNGKLPHVAGGAPGRETCGGSGGRGWLVKVR
jgi:hypothetical protein